MKHQCNPIESPSLLYLIIEEMLFLKETRKISNYIAHLFASFSIRLKTRYKKIITNEWTRAFLILAGYMTFSSFLLLIGYKLVMIF